MYNIETERCFLRMPATADLDALARIFGNARVMQYLGLDCQPLAREQTEIALRSIIDGWAKNGFGRWAVVSKERDEFIGLAGFRKHENIGELFYVLDEPYWGKGLATEIAGEIIRVGFERHNFPRIIAFTRPANRASRRILEKLRLKFTSEVDVYGVSVVEYVITKEAQQSGI